jgi:transglutaminase-like putative cysteine protease
VQRATLALLVAAADAALAVAQESRVAWVLMALAPLALFVRGPRLAPGVVRVLTWVSRALTLAVVVRGEDLGRPLGIALAALGVLFLTDERAFPTALVLMPTVVGILLAAASSPTAAHFTATAWLAAGALTLWLLSRMRTNADPWRRLATVVFLGMSAGIAHGLIVLLPWAQPQVEQAAVGYMYPNGAETGLSVGGRLGDVAELALSPRVVMRMWSDRPANLRQHVFTRFDGGSWQGPLKPRALITLRPTSLVLAPAADEDEVGGWFLLPQAADRPSAHVARFVLVQRTLGLLPAPGNVDALRGLEDSAQLDRFGLVVAPPRVIDQFSVRYAPGPLVEETDADVLTECREPPPHPDPRLVALARQLATGAESASEKIRRTAAHLQSHYRYSLKVGAFQTKDPVAEFLFDKKKGYCEYFAAATVLLLRLEGVPARYVSGLSVRDNNRRGDHYVVRDSDSHAWAEALVPGVGWVEVDSTPAADYDEMHGVGHEGWWDAMTEAVRSWWADLTTSVQHGGWLALWRRLRRGTSWLVRAFWPWLLLAAAGFAALRWRRHARSRRPVALPPSIGVSPDLLANLRRLEALWARSGVPRPAHRAPLEHATSVPADRISEDLRTLGITLTQCFYRGAYGGYQIPAAEVEALARALDDVSARIGN